MKKLFGAAMSKDIGELSESEEGELIEPDQGDKGAANWMSLGEELEAVDPELNLSKGDSQTQDSLWNGPMTRSRLRNQEKALLLLLQLVGNKAEGEIQDKPACWFSLFACN